ncbi:MAG: hypothetical protein Q8K94_06585, partial [Moraxellaceae bacterium]|nr:hypothetical protein [Moraxellaceae bacterium]
MDNKQLEIIQTIVAMFKAAPGAKYLGEFTTFVNTADGSVAGLANVLANTGVFKQSMYADTLTNQEFSAQFVENMLGSLVNVENKSWAASEIENMLAAGQSRGDVIHWAATALASVDTANPDWGAAALQFNNKVDVAAYYSVDLGGSASTLSILQQVTADVTNLAATVNAAKALFETGVSGNVIDGYVKGATVFADLNGDGILNAGEASTTTDAFGNFKFPAGAAGFGKIIAIGGTDIATGKPFEGIMTAPAGSSVVNPLTTLIDKITQDGTTSVNQAAAKVLTSLGLNTGVDLLNFDPIAETVRTDTSPAETGAALAIQAAATKVNTLISQTAALLNGAGVSATEDVGIESAYAALATALTGNSTSTVDLASNTVIAQVIQAAAATAGANSTQTSAVAGL